MRSRTALAVFLAVCVIIALLLLTQHVSIEAGAVGFAVALVVLGVAAGGFGAELSVVRRAYAALQTPLARSAPRSESEPRPYADSLGPPRPELVVPGGTKRRDAAGA